MAFVFKSYDPMKHQQRAKQRQKKRSAGCQTLAQTSDTCLDGPAPSQSLAVGHESLQADEKFIPLINIDRTQDPYSDFPSSEECLELCSRKDTAVSSPSIPTSFDLLSYSDSAIEIQDASSDADSIYQDDGYKGDKLKQKLLAAIATKSSISTLNLEQEAYNFNTSCSPAPTTVPEDESDTETSPVETSPGTASSTSTPSVLSPAGQKEAWRDQGVYVNSQGGVQDACTCMANLDVPDTMTNAALSETNLLTLECQDNVTLETSTSGTKNRPHNQASRVRASAASTADKSFTEPSVLELTSDKKIPARHTASSSMKRSFSEGNTTSSSQLYTPQVCHSPKRTKFTSTSSEEAILTLLQIQKMISNTLANLCQGQPPGLISDVNIQSTADVIEVAGDGVSDDSSDNGSTCSRFDDSESETEATSLRRQCYQQRKTQRRRWTDKEEKLLQTLKGAQKRNGGKPSDYQISRKLDRTESAIKQHWDIMMQRGQEDSMT